MRDYTVKNELLLKYLNVYFEVLSVICWQQQNQQTCRNTHSHIIHSREVLVILPFKQPFFCVYTPSEFVSVAIVTFASPLLAGFDL